MILPSQDYRRTAATEPTELHRGLDAKAHGLVGFWKRHRRVADRLGEEADRIHGEAAKLATLSDRLLRDRLAEIKLRLRRQDEGRREIVPGALACIVEAAERTLGLRPYPVQVVGAMALDQGFLTEMATGEGKTLTACLPMILAAWTGRPVHLVTVNDYLSDRDASEMRPLYSFCGVSVGCVTGEMREQERYQNYQKDAVYITSKELVADFLRDRLRLGKLQHPTRRLIRKMLQEQPYGADGIVMRGLDTAIVDEADSVLIDEAVTPLIISRERENRTLREACRAAGEIANSLKLGTDYRTDLKYREIRMMDAAEEKIQALSEKLPGIWQGALRREELVQQALTAREFYHRDKQYVIDDDRGVIVDEFTGRLMPNRTWRAGLHQAVEAKEGLDATSPSETMARLSFQRFFRQFRRLSGMTGTASEASAEFWHIYGLPVISIPTHKPCIRQTHPDQVFATRQAKFQAIVEEIMGWNALGRPVLVGTRSVEASETLASLLAERGRDFNLLNATRHQEEARIVAAAGQEGKITIATNMAGLGTDIKLGRGVTKLGGLHVIASERHESKRIDRQLFGRSARQGDPGNAGAYVSVDDELIRRFVPSWVGDRLRQSVEADLPGVSQLAKQTLSYAQRAAEKLAFRQRKIVLGTDDRLEDSLGFTSSTGGV